jgi:hypothetical protein
MPYGFDENDWDEAKTEALQVLQNRASRGFNQVISYTDLVNSLTAINIAPHDPRLYHFLEEIVIDEHNNARPLITVLVVHKHGDQMPGNGFYEIADRLGFDIENREGFWIQELQRTLNYWQQANA